MIPDLTWLDMGSRLGLALLAGLIFGLDRQSRDRAAGLRTVTLVCLAAALAMVLAEAVIRATPALNTEAMRLDPMRLPLGILTGVGFIGGGAILRRGGTVTGVTTAATLWFVSVLGLCFGAGQIAIGVAGTALGWGVVWLLKRLESRLPQSRPATLSVSGSAEALRALDLPALLAGAGYRLVRESASYGAHGPDRDLECHLRLELRGVRPKGEAQRPPPFLSVLAARHGVERVSWRP